MKEFTKFTNKLLLCNLPCIAYQFYVLFYSSSFDEFAYRSNFVILFFGVMNLSFFTALVVQSYLQRRTNKKNAIIIGLAGNLAGIIFISYYAISPLALYHVIDGADKNITTVIFDKKEYPDLAEDKLAICKTDQFCYIDVVKFRVYPTHGGMVDLNISPMKNLSIILRPIPMSNIHFMLNQVVLTENGWK